MNSLRKWLLRSFFGLLVLFLLAFGSGAFLTSTSSGRSVTASLIGSLASSDSMAIEVEDVKSLVGEIRIGAVRLSDPDGVWLEARDFKADYSLWDLFSLRLKSSQISLGSLTIERAPLPSDQPATSDGPLIPDLPAVRARIEDISVTRISLGESLLGTAADLTVTGDLTLEDQPLRIAGALEIAHIDADQGHVKAVWDFVPAEDRRKIDLELSEPRGGLATRLLKIDALPAIDLTLSGDGPTSDWASQLAVSLDNRQIVSGQLQANLDGDTRRIEAKLGGQLAPFTPAQFVPLVAGTSDLSFTLEQTGATDQLAQSVVTLPSLTFTSALARIDGAGVVDFGNNAMNVKADFALGESGTEIAIEPNEGSDALRIGATRASVRLKGALDQAALTLDARIEGFSQGDIKTGLITASAASREMDLNMRSGDITAQLILDQLTTGTAPVDAMTKGKVSLALAGALEGSAMTLEKAHLDGGLLTADFAGDLSGANLDIDGSFALSDLSVVDPTLKGALAGDLALSGETQNPQLAMTVNGDALFVADKAINNLALKIQTDATPNASIALSARYDEQPLDITATVSSTPSGETRISDIALTGPGTEVKGDITVSAAGMATGALGADIKDLGELGPLLLQPDLSGSLKASITLSERENRQAILVDVSAPKLAQGETSLSQLALKAQLLDPTGTMTIDATLDVDSLLVANETVRRLTVEASGENGSIPFSATARVSGAPMALEGTATQGSEDTRIVLNHFDGSWSGVALKLRDSAEIVLADTVRFEKPLALSIDNGQATVSGSVGTDLAIDVALRAIPLSIVDKVAPTNEAIAGQIDLDAKISGPSSNPVVKWQGTVGNLSANSTRNAGVPALGIASSGQYQGDSVSLQTVITGGGSKLNLDGQVAIASQQLDLNAQGTLPFSLAARALADAGIRMDGTATLSASITGAATSPQISGTMSTNGARFIELSSGIVIRDLSGTVRLTGQTAQIEAISGRIGKDGTLSINGTVSIDAAQQMPADIAIDIKGARFTHETILSTVFDADLALKGQLAGNSVVSGAINLATTEISIPESLPSSLSPLDVQHKNASGKLAEQVEKLQPATQTASTGGPSIGLDMVISSPRRIYVRGRGMDAELGGRIRLSGTTANPNPVGSVSMVRGRIDLLTKRLDFDTGSVTFSGSLDPALDFVATTFSGGATYSLGVGGYASEPEIELSSTPTLPEDEILAHLFFDRDLSSLSALQIAQLANAVATISGANSGPGVLDRLRGLAGLDNIDIKSDEQTGETTVGAGSYLNDKTYINVEKGATNNTGKVSIDLTITNQLKARGEADSEGNSKAGIFFEQDY